jgi:cytidine deaminase
VKNQQVQKLSVEELIGQARQARDRAYAPYSDFRVGAALECRDGRIFTGCNVENASYGLCNCAERAAIFKAVSDGATDFRRIAVIADTENPVSPCGACRQVMLEILGEDVQVIMCNLRGATEIRTVSELLPLPFKKLR